MHVIFGEDTAAEMAKKYTVLELDRIQLEPTGPVLNSYCVLEKDNVPMQDIGKMQNVVSLHAKLMENYRKKDWNFCEQALEHLHGSFNGTLNSFYDHISKRIAKYKQQDPGLEWNGIYAKYDNNN
jgi:hypothetical protein